MFPLICFVVHTLFFSTDFICLFPGLYGCRLGADLFFTTDFIPIYRCFYLGLFTVLQVLEIESAMVREAGWGTSLLH